MSTKENNKKKKKKKASQTTKGRNFTKTNSKERQEKVKKKAPPQRQIVPISSQLSQVSVEEEIFTSLYVTQASLQDISFIIRSMNKPEVDVVFEREQENGKKKIDSFTLKRGATKLQDIVQIEKDSLLRIYFKHRQSDLQVDTVLFAANLII